MKLLENGQNLNNHNLNHFNKSFCEFKINLVESRLLILIKVKVNFKVRLSKTLSRIE